MWRDASYTVGVPKLWNETIQAHRREVRDAILDATAALVAELGLLSVTMSQIAERTGIGRATLYKYFPDVETILIAWHDRQVGDHLRQLAEVRSQITVADQRLGAVMEAYALIHHRRVRQHSQQPYATELAVFVHQDEHVARATQQVKDMVRELLAEAVKSGQVRQDVAADELASYCVHALAAASGLPSETAVRRLVAVVLSGLRPISPIPDRGIPGS